MLLRGLFGVRVRGLEHWAAAGERVLIIANHVSLIDGLVLYAFLPVPPTFAIRITTAQLWYVRLLKRFFAHLDLDTRSPVALKAMVRLLQDDQRLLMFPEARMTTTGTPMKVYDGAGMIADHSGAMILPVALSGLQHARLNALAGLVRQRWLPRVTVTLLPPRPLALADTLVGAARRDAATSAVAAIMQEIAYTSAFEQETLFAALARAATNHGSARPILEDSTGAALTYRQLLTRAFALGALIARRAPRESRLGVLLPSTAAGVVTVFACLARGYQVAMLNFTGGQRGLVTALETAGIKLVLTSRTFVEAAGLGAEVEALANRAEIVYLEDARASLSLPIKLTALLCARAPRLAHRWLGRGAAPDDPAIILFTSGSEGIPKGVVLSHANLLANFAQIQMLIDLTQRDRVLNVLPIFHAFGLQGGVLLPLLKGTPSFQYPSPLHYRIVPELCYEHRVTCLFGTTTFLRGYARHAHRFDFHRMRYVIAGAEKLTDDTRNLWFDNFGIRIFEGYGATEAGPVIAVNHPLACRNGTVGQLVTGMSHYLEPVEGIKDGGELVVRGPNIMLGYLFHGSDGDIIKPWTTRAGAGWYETGDIVSIDEDGYVRIQGRAKRFAKLGGEMVSLAAVEELAFMVWPDARHAAVTVPDARKGEQITLFTSVAGAERAALVTAARSIAASELLIPRQVVHLEEIPLLGSGKVDYPTLKERIERRV